MAAKPRAARDDGRYAAPVAGVACWGVAVVTPGPDWTYVILKERRVESVKDKLKS